MTKQHPLKNSEKVFLKKILHQYCFNLLSYELQGNFN
jgi:hypothetical protein